MDILRGDFFLVKQACNLLKNPNNSDDPLEHGWVERFGMLLPDKNLKSLPEFVLKICKCQKSCESKNCRCKAEGVKCTIYCHSKTISKQCKKPKRWVLWVQYENQSWRDQLKGQLWIIGGYRNDICIILIVLMGK